MNNYRYCATTLYHIVQSNLGKDLHEMTVPLMSMACTFALKYAVSMKDTYIAPDDVFDLLPLVEDLHDVPLPDIDESKLNFMYNCIPDFTVTLSYERELFEEVRKIFDYVDDLAKICSYTE